MESLVPMKLNLYTTCTIHENTNVHDLCIAHYIGKVVAEEEKKRRKPRPNKPHPLGTNKHKMNRTLGYPALRSRTVGSRSFMVNQLSPHTQVSYTYMHNVSTPASICVAQTKSLNVYFLHSRRFVTYHPNHRVCGVYFN